MDDLEDLDDDLDLELSEPRLRDSEFDLEVDDPDEVLFDEPLDLLLWEVLPEPLLELRLLRSPWLLSLTGAATAIFGGLTSCSSVKGGDSSHSFNVCASGFVLWQNLQADL